MAKRYRLPIEETDNGKKTILFSSAIKDLEIEKDQSVMLYYTPDQPVATLYVFNDMVEIAMWLKSDSTNRIGFVKSDDEKAKDQKIESVPEKHEDSSSFSKHEDSSHKGN